MHSAISFSGLASTCLGAFLLDFVLLLFEPVYYNSDEDFLACPTYKNSRIGRSLTVTVDVYNRLEQHP